MKLDSNSLLFSPHNSKKDLKSKKRKNKSKQKAKESQQYKRGEGNEESEEEAMVRSLGNLVVATSEENGANKLSTKNKKSRPSTPTVYYKRKVIATEKNGSKDTENMKNSFSQSMPSLSVQLDNQNSKKPSSEKASKSSQNSHHHDSSLSFILTLVMFFLLFLLTVAVFLPENFNTLLK